MRVRAIFIAALLLLVPFSASADAQLDALCKGYTGDPSGSQTFEQGGSPSIMDNFLKRKVLCPSACYDVTLTLSIESQKLKIVTSAVNKCKSPQPDQSKVKNVYSPLEKPNDDRNCKNGQGLPAITAITKKLDPNTSGVPSIFSGMVPPVFNNPVKVGPKSRCDQSATNVITSFTSNGNNGLDVGLQQMAGLSTPTQPPASAETQPDPSTATTPTPDTTPKPNEVQPIPTDKDALAQLLTDKYKIPSEQAKALVESDADKIKDMISKSMSNDVAGAQAIAKELKLNDDVINNIATMQPPKPMTTEDARDIYERQQQERQERQNTFDQNPQSNGNLPTQCGVEGTAGNIMFAESRCGQINSNPLSSVRGPYHFLCGTWQAYANSTGNGQYADCSYRDDPQIATKVMNDKMNQFAQQYGERCTSAGLSITSCQYAIHVFGEGGFKGIYNAYVNGANNSAFSLCGSAVSQAACSNNISIFRNGGTVAGVFGELDRRLGGNGTIIPTMANNGSPFSGVTSGNGYYNSVGSPFGGVNLFGYNGTGYSTPTGYSTTYGYPNGNAGYGGGSFFSNLFGGSNSYQNPNQTQIQYVPQQQQQPVVTIIAQPQNAFKGNAIVISWSSVGTRSDAPCVVQMIYNGTTSTLAASNEGSKIVTATSSGIIQLSAKCTGINGQALVRSTNVSVQ